MVLVLRAHLRGDLQGTGRLSAGPARREPGAGPAGATTPGSTWDRRALPWCEHDTHQRGWGAGLRTLGDAGHGQPRPHHESRQPLPLCLT